MKKKDTILIVDDIEMNRVILGSIFEENYKIMEAENGEQALSMLEQYHDNIVVVLLDLVMPVKNGYAVMEEMGRKGLISEVPVVIITAEDSVESEVQAFDLGASDIIMKPFEPHVVGRRVKNIMELNRRKLNQEEIIEEQAAKLRESNSIMVDTLSSLIEYRSVETGQHVKRIRMFTKVLLEDIAKNYEEFNLDDHKIEVIASASSMHDVGKIAIPDNILNKPGRLTKEEFEVMKTHSMKGCEILEKLTPMSDKEYLRYAYNICRHHHERWDGTGYPDGLSGERIPVCAQAVGIADCYDALTNDRVYKKAIPAEQALNMILQGECGTFSPKMLECLKNVKNAFMVLTYEYADSNMKKEYDFQLSENNSVKEERLIDTLQMGQMKYFTMLRYVDSTVMEADLNTGVYHLVYRADKYAEMLSDAKSFDEAVRCFIEQLVHPEDREKLQFFMEKEMNGFFSEGTAKKSWNYRMRMDGGQDYEPCRMTIIRIDTGYAHERKVLIVWNRNLTRGLEKE